MNLREIVPVVITIGDYLEHAPVFQSHPQYVIELPRSVYETLVLGLEAADVRNRVAERLTELTGLEIEGDNIQISEIIPPVVLGVDVVNDVFLRTITDIQEERRTIAERQAKSIRDRQIKRCANKIASLIEGGLEKDAAIKAVQIDEKKLNVTAEEVETYWEKQGLMY